MTTTAEAIDALLRGHTDRDDEARILSLLATDDAIDVTLQHLDLDRLFADVDDRLFGPDHRQSLRRLLSHTRLNDLSVAARCRLVAALQRGRTCRADEEAIRDVLLGTRGADLTALKNALDHGDDHRDLQQLVYGDIDDDAIREAILDHFAAEQAPPEDDLKILSDIDDTFYANWKDRRYPKKTVYPGVRQLYLELDRGPAGELGDVVFVTARPQDRTGWVESATHRSLRERGLETATILCGALTHLHSNASIADRKFQNFVEYAALYPEYRFVFVGDSGQGDADFGRRMRAHAPDRVELVLIHDVVATPQADRAVSAEEGVVLFDTYVGAAVTLHGAGLLSVDAAHRVADAALAELEALVFDDEETALARQREFVADVERLPPR